MSADSTPPPPYASPNNLPPDNINVNNNNGDDNTNRNSTDLYDSIGNATGLYDLFLTAVGAAPDVPPTAGTSSSEEEVWIVADDSNTLAQQPPRPQQQQQQHLVPTAISNETTIPPPPILNAVGHDPAATLQVGSRFNETNINNHATGGGIAVDDFNRHNIVGTRPVSAAVAPHVGPGRGGASEEIGTGTPVGSDRDARRRRRRHLVSGGDGGSIGASWHDHFGHSWSTHVAIYRYFATYVNLC